MQKESDIYGCVGEYFQNFDAFVAYLSTQLAVFVFEFVVIIPVVCWQIVVVLAPGVVIVQKRILGFVVDDYVVQSEQTLCFMKFLKPTERIEK
jgi:hypothetical protein